MSGQSQSTAGDRILNAVKNNPEGLLLLAAGAALLLRSTPSPRTRSAGSQDWDPEQQLRHPQGSSMSGGDWAGPAQLSASSDQLSAAKDTVRQYAAQAKDTGRQYADTARQYASDARRYASDMGSKVADTASSYVSSADEARRAAMERSGHFVSQAQSTLQETGNRLMQDQPLLVALAGLAAGAAVAAAFPRTDIEERALGPAGEQLTEYASRTAEQFKSAGMKAGEQLVSSAQQRGLNTEGIKEMAHEAADAFGQAFSGSSGDAGRTAPGESSPSRANQAGQGSGPSFGESPPGSSTARGSEFRS